MLSQSILTLGLAATGFASRLSFRQKNGLGNKCPPFSGDFNVAKFQLYSENSDFDSVNCKFFIG